MKTRRFFSLFLAALLLCSFAALPAKAQDASGVAKANETLLPELAEIRRELICAWASLAAYNDRIGEVARDHLESFGYQIDSVHEQVGKSDVKYLFLKHKNGTAAQVPALLVITGTENLRDAGTAMDLAPVVFSGEDPYTDLQEKYRTATKVIEPRVHLGYDRYTRAAFFTPDTSGKTIGDEIAAYLAADPQAKIVITGHSLGGAVATLCGARLINSGVNTEQLEVITFGAPAVGNHTFASYYLSKLRLTRIVMAADPIYNLMQKLPDDYVQFGKKKEWAPSKAHSHSAHEMITYLDAALHRYYDMAANALPPRDETAPKVYIAPISFSLEGNLATDQLYMDEAMRDMLARKLGGAIFSSNPAENVAQAMASAAKRGAQFVLIEAVRAERVPNARNEMRLILAETVYDAGGSLVFYQDVATSLKKLTPIEACLFNQISFEKARCAAIDKAIANNAAAPPKDSSSVSLLRRPF